MLDGEKILITGATGKIAFPIARALAERNEVWGAARLRNPGDRDKLTAAGINPVALDMSTGDFSAIPDDFSYVFHAAVDTGADDWRRCVETNAQNSGDLLFHCRNVKGFVFCSTGSIYGYQGQRPLTEADPPGVPLRANYSFSKIAAESVCTWVAKQYGIPLTIIRICSTYGPEGGAPADRLEMMLAHKPIRLHPDAPNNYNPIYEDDYVDLGIRAMEVADTPADRGELGGQRDSQRGGLLHVHGRTGRGRTEFRCTPPEAHTPLWPDVTYMHQILGQTKMPWREGFRRMVAARHPEIALADLDSPTREGQR